MFSDADLSAIAMSLRVSCTATLAFALPGALLGVWLAQTRSPIRPIVQAAVTIPLVLPPVVIGLLLLWLLLAAGSSLIFTWWAAALASGVVASPLLVRTVQAAAENMDPRLCQVAATLGASPTRILLTVVMPACWKGLVGGLILFWARAVGEFGAVMIVASNTPGRTQTIPLAIYSNLESAKARSVWPLVAAAIGLSLVAMIASEWLTRRKPSRPTPRDMHPQ